MQSLLIYERCPLFFVVVGFLLGPTEREILANFEDIVEHALPLEKMKNAYSNLNSAKNIILNHITFWHTPIDVI